MKTTSLHLCITGPDRSPLSITLATNDGIGPVADDVVLLEWLFRQLNAVDGRELISIAGIRQPSLSVGDWVQISESTRDSIRTYACAGCGWEPVEPTYSTEPATSNVLPFTTSP